MSETNLHKLADGNVVIYLRPNSNTDFWYCRIKLPKNGKWKKLSTKTNDLSEAKNFALQKFEVFKQLTEANFPVDGKRFSQVADITIKNLQAELDAGVGKATYVDYIRVINRYKEFFGNKYIQNISYQDLVEFDRDRTRKLKRKAKQSTINLHNTALMRVYQTAIQKGWMHKSQVITFKNDGKKTERRPAFDLEEYRKLYRFMRGYVKRTTGDSKKGGVTRQTVWIRELLRDMVLFLVNTGLRFGTETRGLKWKHISETTIKGEKYLKIDLEKGKTGPRVIIARHSTRNYLERIKSRFPELCERKIGEMQDVDVPVFRLRDRSVPKDFHGAFEILLREAGLLCDSNGNRRSLYSLRHTYATFQILYSEIDLHTLAKNMGTSIGMLEKHYSHLEVLQRADALAGRRIAQRFTEIIELDTEDLPDASTLELDHRQSA